MNKWLTIFGNNDLFKDAPKWAKCVFGFNNNIYYTPDSTPKAGSKYARFIDKAEGCFNAHMFKSTKHKFCLLAQRIDIFNDNDVWMGKDEPVSNQICRLSQDFMGFEEDTTLIVGGSIDFYHGKMFGVQVIGEDEFILVSLKLLKAYKTDEDIAKEKSFSKIANILNLDINDEKVEKLYRAIKLKEIL